MDHELGRCAFFSILGENTETLQRYRALKNNSTSIIRQNQTQGRRESINNRNNKNGPMTQISQEIRCSIGFPIRMNQRSIPICGPQASLNITDNVPQLRSMRNICINHMNSCSGIHFKNDKVRCVSLSNLQHHSLARKALHRPNFT